MKANGEQPADAMGLIRWALTLSDQGTARLVEDMRSMPMTQPVPGAKSGGGNHPLWCIGHLCLIEGVVAQAVTGGANPVEGWKPLFAAGTTPQADAGAYPPFDEVLGKFRELRASNLKLLDEVGEAGLARPPKAVPPGFEDVMKTNGQAFLLMAMHNMVHYGQIADARRAAGHKPLF